MAMNMTYSTNKSLHKVTHSKRENERKFLCVGRKNVLIASLIIILSLLPTPASSYKARRSYHQHHRYASSRPLVKTSLTSGFRRYVNRYPGLRPSSTNVIDKKTLLGPNVCGSKCCEGWTSGNTALCITPVCRPSCSKGGRCVRPNVCYCKTAYRGKYCQRKESSKMMIENKRKRDPRQTVVHVRYREPYSHKQRSQSAKVACSPMTCFNGGTCVDGSCVCREGYMGHRCEKVVVITTSIASELPGADEQRSTSTAVALKLCKALCVHGTCRTGSGPICRCHAGYHGAMCDSSYSRPDKEFPAESAVSGLKYSNNFLRPVVSYSNQQTRRIPTVKYVSSRLPSRSKFGKCFKSYGGVSCGLSFNAIMTMQTCCSDGLGDAWGWRDKCLSCRTIGSSEVHSTTPERVEERHSSRNNCPEGFRLLTGRCHDVNECLLKSDICANGRCNNIRGSYWCQCNKGHHQHISKKYCLPDVTGFRNVIGRSNDKCYLSLDRNGHCSKFVSSARGNKAVCCCSIGVAWGSACEKCPSRGSGEYRRLCPRSSGYQKPSTPRTTLRSRESDVTAAPQLVTTPPISRVSSTATETTTRTTKSSRKTARPPTPTQDIVIPTKPVLTPSTGSSLTQESQNDFTADGTVVDVGVKHREGISKQPEHAPVIQAAHDTTEAQSRATNTTHYDNDTNALVVPTKSLVSFTADPTAYVTASSVPPTEAVEEGVGVEGGETRDGLEKAVPPIVTPEDSDEQSFGYYGTDIEDSVIVDQYDATFDDIDEMLYSETAEGDIPAGVEEVTTQQHQATHVETKTSIGSVQIPHGSNGIGFDAEAGEESSISVQKGEKYVAEPSALEADTEIVPIHVGNEPPLGEFNNAADEILLAKAAQEFETPKEEEDGKSRAVNDSGIAVEPPTDPCSLAPCLHGGACESQNDGTSFKCRCTEGYFGILCETKDYCVPDPCLNGATCEAGIKFYYCDCVDGYTGTNCETERSKCESNPCLHGVCSDVMDGFECDCNAGYQGKTCDEDSDECLNLSLCHGGRCVNSEGSFYCKCFSGFKVGPDRTKCEEVDHCEYTDCGRTAICRNVPGSYVCVCANENEEYDQEKKECISPYVPVIRKPCYSTPYSCDNVLSTNLTKEECCCTIGQSWGDCRSRQDCPMMRADFERECSAGRGLSAGENFAVNDLNECLLFGDQKVCGSGRCVNSFGRYECVCYSGFYYNGRIQACDDINECRVRNKCIGGRCLNLRGSYKCQCPPGSVLRYNGFVSTCTKPSSGRFPYRPALKEPEEDAAEESVFKDFCYSRIMRKYMCAGELPIKYSYEVCCCSVGVAWGSSCSKCPDRHTDDYRFLCKRKKKPVKIPSLEEQNGPEAFHAQDCGLAKECMNGRCLRTEDGFTCECNVGFSLDKDLATCIDINECDELEETSRLCSNGVCVNEPGSFRCLCHDGFHPSTNDSTICLPTSTGRQPHVDIKTNVTTYS